MARTKQTARMRMQKRLQGKPVRKAKKATVTASNSSQTMEKKARKPHRWRPGTVALREIRKIQKGTGLLIPKAPFERVVRELGNEQKPGVDIRWSKDALEAIQMMAEDMLIHRFATAQIAAIHANRITVTPKDMWLAARVDRFSGFKMWIYLCGRICDMWRVHIACDGDITLLNNAWKYKIYKFSKKSQNDWCPSRTETNKHDTKNTTA